MDMDLNDIIFSNCFLRMSSPDGGILKYSVKPGHKVTLIDLTDEENPIQHEVFGIEVFGRNDNLYYTVDCGFLRRTRYARQHVTLDITEVPLPSDDQN